jgi:glucokinase
VDREVDASSVERYRNAEHEGIASVIASYLDLRGITDAQIGGVCVAGAGPVRDGVVQLTNLDWRVDRNALASVLTAEKSSVLNDLQAQGHAIGHILPANLVEVLPQPPHSPNAARLVVGLGTGFNACPVFDTEAGRFVPPSEAGHVALPVTVPGLDAIIDRIGDSHGFPSVEEVLSGRGVSTLHAALHGVDVQPADVLAGMADRDAQALATGRLFVQVMGHVIGDLALSHLPFAGHLAGGRRVARLCPLAGRIRLCRGVPRQGPVLGLHGTVRRAGRDRRLRGADRLRVASGQALSRR